jgi:hypothetical protein
MTTETTIDTNLNAWTAVSREVIDTEGLLSDEQWAAFCDEHQPYFWDRVYEDAKYYFSDYCQENGL